VEPRISLCMIVRDEADVLGACLDAAREAADEIVVVDTGSTDRSAEIARSRGALVVHEPWRDDFSAARNAGLERATGDWILVLDADEILAPGGAEKIRAAAKAPGCVGYYLPIVNVFDGGERVTALIVRLFRNHPTVRYVNRIHEQVLEPLLALAGERGETFAVVQAPVAHDGYRESVVALRGKDERNRRLFELQVGERPDDPYSWYKFADFLRRAGTAGEAAAALRRALELVRRSSEDRRRRLPYAAEVFALLALGEVEAGRKAEARALVDEGFATTTATAHLHFARGVVALKDGDAALAEASFSECVRNRDLAAIMPAQPGVTGYRSLHGMGAARYARGDREGARRAFLDAVADNPRNRDSLVALVHLARERNDAKEAMTRLHQIVREDPRDAEAWTLGGEILLRLGLLARAEQWLSRADGPRAAFLEGVARLRSGDPAGALERFRLHADDRLCRAGIEFVTAGPDGARVGSAPAEAVAWLSAPRGGTGSNGQGIGA